MKRVALIGLLMLAMGAPAMAQTSRPSPDVRTFELSPVAPPTPALKYQLLFDDLGDRRPGNAAILYLDSILLMGPDTKDKAQKALDAYAAKDDKTFDALADSLELPSVFQELDLAGRRERCDWEPPFREMGAYTLLPQLEPLAHGMTRLIKVKALRQIERGNIEGSLSALRLGYEMSNNVGTEPILISGLVSVAITAQMNDALVPLMNRPESPNLYWALCEMPSRREILRRALDGERQWWVTSYPNLVKTSKGQDLAMMVKNGVDLSPEQWRSLLDYVYGLLEVAGEPGPPHPDPVKDAGADTLRKAKEEYAQTHHMTEQQIETVDPLVVVGPYYFHQYEAAYDEMFKLRGLAYPVLLAKSKDYANYAEKLKAEEPANPFVQALPAIHNAIWSFARTDRQLAALTAVEALRSYAAAHDGKLPQHLEDVTETPVPENPATGKPFGYRLENDTATLSDSQGDSALTYTVRIRK